MNKMMKNNKGITLLALVIIIIVMMIIASIVVYEGTKIIDKSHVQTIQTNMLTIQAKAKAYAEEVEAKVWAYTGNKKQNKTEDAFEAKKMEETTISENEVIQQIDPDIITNYVAYKFNAEALTDMGLSDLENQKDNYIVVYSNDNNNKYKKIDVIYLAGMNYEGEKYFSLSKLQTALKSEE